MGDGALRDRDATCVSGLTGIMTTAADNRRGRPEERPRIQPQQRLPIAEILYGAEAALSA
jgi:hypothetical protein